VKFIILAGSYLDFKEDVDAWFKVKMPEIDSFAKDILNKKATIMYRPIPGMRFISKQGHKLCKTHV